MGATGTSIIAILFIVIFGLFMLAFCVVWYVLNGLALMRMAKSCGLKHPWMGFVPFADAYLMGQLAECNPTPGKKSWPWRHILLVGQIVVVAAMLIMYVGLFGSMIGAIDEYGDFGVYDMYTMYGGAIGAISLFQAVSIAYSVLVYIVYWKIYSLFAPDLAVIFLVLTILLNVTPILLFIIRKRQPVVKAPPTNTYWQ